jgi:hypothetical protein
MRTGRTRRACGGGFDAGSRCFSGRECVTAGSNELATSCVTERFSKLEVQRELDLAGAGPGNWLLKSGYRSQT